MARSPANCGAHNDNSKRSQTTNQEKETDGADPMGSGEPLVTRVTGGGLGGGKWGGPRARRAWGTWLGPHQPRCGLNCVPQRDRLTS